MENQERVSIPIPPEVDLLSVLGVNDANLRALEETFPSVNFWFGDNSLFLQGTTAELPAAQQAALRLISPAAAPEAAATRALASTQSNEPARNSAEALQNGLGGRFASNAGALRTVSSVSDTRASSASLDLRYCSRRSVEEKAAAQQEAYPATAQSAAAQPTRNASFNERAVLVNREKVIRPKTAGQANYIRDIDTHTVTFAIGPAGTGKTYLAMARAVRALLDGEVSRLILTRPAVEAGEALGFLPGTLTDKIDPYLRPLYDALREMLDTGTISKMMSDGTIEVAALAYMRGRTLNGAFVILDEAQNTTSEQMKMFLTRLGFGSKMVVTGDITQIDLPSRQPSGLKEVRDILGRIPDIAFTHLTSSDVVRHSLVGEIIEAYQEFEDK